ncbi:MAG: hypothetical protein K6A94_12335 [Bacteroidales bacterium]|nr:hypothetical protein [Bacteroidales bacterium]
MIRFLMNRMSASDWTLAQDGTGFAFRRGFTGHEHYDRFGITRPSGCSMPCRWSDPADVRVMPLVWICNPDPLSIRIFNPPGSNEQNRNCA